MSKSASQQVVKSEMVQTAHGVREVQTLATVHPKSPTSNDAMLALAESVAALGCIEALPKLTDDMVVLIPNAFGMVTPVSGAEVKRELLKGIRGFQKSALQAQARDAESRIRKQYGPHGE